MTKFCTYLYKDPKTGIPRYVGMGLARRPYEHLRRAKNPQLESMLRKRTQEGFNPRPVVISAKSSDDAKEMEVLLIALIGRKDLGQGTLFNHTDGGEGAYGRIDSNEARQKRRDAINNQTPEERSRILELSRLTRSQKTEAEKQASFERRSQARKQVHAARSAEVKLAVARKVGFRPCTVDGVSIYHNRLELVASLGQGKHGSRSPNFRYLSPEEIKAL